MHEKCVKQNYLKAHVQCTCTVLCLPYVHVLYLPYVHVLCLREDKMWTNCEEIECFRTKQIAGSGQGTGRGTAYVITISAYTCMRFVVLLILSLNQVPSWSFYLGLGRALRGGDLLSTRWSISSHQYWYTTWCSHYPIHDCRFLPYTAN